MNAVQRITDLLATRHTKDIFVPQCKDGPTGQGMLQLDAWAMRRSYNVHSWGYEIKLTRGDFLRDKKWQDYLGYCHEFYFVAPSGVIDISEVPAAAGLIVPSKNLTRLYTKKKAPRREVQIGEALYLYLLICRTRVVRTIWPGDGDKDESEADYWRAWLNEKQEKRMLGYRVRRAMNADKRKLLDDTQGENMLLKAQNKHLLEIRGLLKREGLWDEDGGWEPSAWDVKQRIADLRRRAKAAVPDGLLPALEAAAKALHGLEEKQNGQ